MNTPSDGGERVTATKWGLALNTERARAAGDAVAVYPRTITLMAGSTYRRFKGVGYDSRSWEQGGDIPEYGISDASLGLIDARTGAFRASDQNSEGYVVVRVGDRKGVARVRVTGDLDEIRFASAAIAVDSGATVALQPELISDGESVTYSAEALAYQVDNTDLCQVNPKDGSVTTAPVQGESCTVRVSAAGQSAELAINIGVAPEIVADFEGDVSAFRAIKAWPSSRSRIRSSTVVTRCNSAGKPTRTSPVPSVPT